VYALALPSLVRRSAIAARAAFVLLALTMCAASCSRSPNGPGTSAPANGPAARLAALPPLAFRADGSFTIVQFTDLHLNSPSPSAADSATLQLVRSITDIEHPDLVVLTGDVSRMPKSPRRPRSWQAVADIFDGRHVPWTYVNGNLDPELSGYARIDSFLTARPYCLYTPGPTTIPGHGNYVLPVNKNGGGIGALLWYFDSGRCSSSPPAYYSWVTAAQVNWFKAESDRLMGTGGATTTGLAFFHIPVKQYTTVWNKIVCTGYRGDPIRTQGKDEGLFAALYGNNRVVATFVGHNHDNDFEGTLNGVTLTNGRVSCPGEVESPGYQAGARVMKLAEGVRGYTSYIRQADGTIADRPVHQPGQPGPVPPPPPEPPPPGPLPTDPLAFRGDGSFTIAQFTDLELSTSGAPTAADLQAINLVGSIIDKDKPDLVVLTGDICIFPRTGPSPAWEALASLLDSKKVHWAYVNGNRDPEKSGYAKIDSIMTSRPWSVYQPGPTTIGGHGNYVLQVRKATGGLGALVWCLDSGTSGAGANWGITASQVDWFTAQSDLLVGTSTTITGLAFMHVPLKQTPTEWFTTTCTGYRYVPILTQGTEYGFYAACQQNSRISGCFFGHNGGNDFEGKLSGVGLCYCRYGMYNSTLPEKPTFQRGARIIQLQSDVRGYQTFIRLDDLTLAPRPTHLPTDPAYSP